MIALAASALAAPGTERDAWPSLPLEQPVVVSRGWWQVDALGRGGADGAGGGGVVRYGVARGLEVALAQDWVDGALAAPALGARLGLGQAEAPSRSAAVVATLRPPWRADGGRDGGRVDLGLAGAVATAPLRWSALATAGWDGAPAWAAEGAVSLQFGPLAPGALLRGGTRSDAAATGQVNFSRGLAVVGERWWALAGPEAGFAVGLRVAL